MRRADRLMQILLALRGKRRMTAEALSAELEVSLRTIYRDMADLMKSGAPIGSEAGAGYWLEAGFSPPPVSFSTEELQALEIGARLVAGYVDNQMGAAAKSALFKVHRVLDSEGLTAPPVFVPDFSLLPKTALSDVMRLAMEKRCFKLEYEDEAGKKSTREVAPLGLFFWGKCWILVAWCFLRAAYRNFRLDRIEHYEATETIFPADISLDAFLRQCGAGDEAREVIQKQNAQFWHVIKQQKGVF